MRNKLAVFLLVLLFAAVAFADDWSKSYQVQGRPQLVVDADDGNVTVSPSAGNDVRLSVHSEGFRIAPDEIEVSSRQDGNRVELTLRKHNQGLRIHFHTSLEIRVSLPAGSDLDVHTRDGNLDISGIQGTQRLRTGDGNAELRGVTGNVDLETGDGNLDVEGRFDTLSLHTGDGNIETIARSGSAMKAGWSLRTGDGNIRIELPSNFAANVDAHTGDGHIRTDFPIATTTPTSESDRQDLRGPLNGGGPILQLRSGDGTIQIRR